MMSRIVDIKPHAGLFKKGEIIAEFDINPECWFFEHHFIGDPLMPGSLMLEGLWQTLGFYLGWSGYPGKVRALGVGDLRLKNEITPDAGCIEYKINIRRIVARGAGNCSWHYLSSRSRNCDGERSSCRYVSGLKFDLTAPN